MGAAQSLDAVRRAVSELAQAVEALRRSYGETLGVRRLDSDVKRLSENLDHLGEPDPSHVEAETELQEIPDTPYDRSMWKDAEDEGFGAPDRHAP